MPDKYKLSQLPLTLMSLVQTVGKTETPLRHSEWKNTKHIYSLTEYKILETNSTVSCNWTTYQVKKKLVMLEASF